MPDLAQRLRGISLDREPRGLDAAAAFVGSATARRRGRPPKTAETPTTGSLALEAVDPGLELAEERAQAGARGPALSS
jgi:hypothetical protein